MGAVGMTVAVVAVTAIGAYGIYRLGKSQGWFVPGGAATAQALARAHAEGGGDIERRILEERARAYAMAHPGVSPTEAMAAVHTAGYYATGGLYDDIRKVVS